tara:strand:- start:1000 stop:1590 length:591 start_codon:yes stop_codon:yes gene_type:complete
MPTFPPESLIYQRGEAAGQRLQYLEKAKELIERWEGMSFCFSLYYENSHAYFEKFFHDESEYHIAALLSFDDLLPESARQVFSLTTIEARSELRNLHHCKNLMMKEIKKGRDKKHELPFIYTAIDGLVLGGYTRNHAFLVITKAHDISGQGFAKRDYEALKLAEYFKSTNQQSEYSFRSINTLRAGYNKYLRNKIK